MTITIIAAMAKNGVIGNGLEIPWHCSEDFKHFKATTLGHPIVMGRKTFDSLGRKPLPKRINAVITRNVEQFDNIAGVVPFYNLDDALDDLKPFSGVSPDQIFVIGGAQIYEQALKIADKLILTEFSFDIEGDVRFPAIDQKAWKKISTETVSGNVTDKNGELLSDRFDIVTYTRN